MESAASEYVFAAWRTIPYGSRAIVIDLAGGHEEVDGPCQRFIWRSHFQILPKVLASDKQYLAVNYADGLVEHVPGPAKFFMNPLVHSGVDVRKKLSINSGQSVVVYSSDGPKGVAVRNAVAGPRQYTPKVGEWLHKFRWLMPDQGSPGLANQTIEFYKLRTVPDQLQFAVVGVRTKDDALLSLKFMIFYHLLDITRMLDTTDDPGSLVLSTLTADTLDFVGKRSFEAFKGDCDQLNLLVTFPQLSARMDACGYRLVKVAYRGYDASEALQQMHDAAIKDRTALQLEQETEIQRQEMEDMKQERSSRRVEKAQELERTTQTHAEAMKRRDVVEELERSNLKFIASLEHKDAAHRAELTRANEEVAAKLDEKRAAMQLDLERRQRTDEQQLATLMALHEKTGLDVTQYMVAQSGKVDRRIEVVAPSPGAEANAAQVHLHSKL